MRFPKRTEKRLPPHIQHRSDKKQKNKRGSFWVSLSPLMLGSLEQDRFGYNIIDTQKSHTHTYTQPTHPSPPDRTSIYSWCGRVIALFLIFLFLTIAVLFERVSVSPQSLPRSRSRILCFVPFRNGLFWGVRREEGVSVCCLYVSLICVGVETTISQTKTKTKHPRRFGVPPCLSLFLSLSLSLTFFSSDRDEIDDENPKSNCQRL